ncbi:hypothetical protein BDV25DRAFT_155828 [Aspergillus avenaceus]|uniref:DUF7721 domain-containing protein n=1 Tax=Aspergillus avenaceus TaxID=36643 RepID=A0A5N6TTR5_ASPAV|nr:hypothetical protein BDV25DRAFT_155828 [Aspergillus avenaceus]
MGFSDILKDAVSQAVEQHSSSSSNNNNNSSSYGENQGSGSYGGQQGYDRPPSHGHGEGSYGHQGSYGGGGEYNDTRYNAPPPSHGGYNSGYGDSSFSQNEALSHAESHHGSSGDSSLFSSALNFLKEKQGRSSSPDIDESQMVQSHHQLYNEDSSKSHNSDSLGAGAAMQALKMFTSGESGSSGGDKNAFIGIAMSQAAKLWEQKNSSGAVQDDKQSAVNKAAEMAMKMYMKNQGSGSSGTGGPALMSLASKFFK